MGDKLILPKKDERGNYYLSYTQYTTWKKSKREYIRSYFFGDRFTGNAYTEFGNLVGEALENNDFSSFRPKEQEFLKTVPRYDEFERVIELQMKGFYVKGYIDSNTFPEPYTKAQLVSDMNKDRVIVSWVREMLDYKTGDIATKQSTYSSPSYKQLHIYAAALKQEYGVYPDDVKVVLIDRRGNAFRGEKLRLGNEYIEIPKIITEKDVQAVLDDVQRVAEEISKYYKLYLNLMKVN
jgi:hypothetical protein